MDGTYRKSPGRNYQLLDHSGRALREIPPGGAEPRFQQTWCSARPARRRPAGPRYSQGWDQVAGEVLR